MLLLRVEGFLVSKSRQIGVSPLVCPSHDESWTTARRDQLCLDIGVLLDTSGLNLRVRIGADGL